MPSYDQSLPADLLHHLNKEIAQMRVLLIDQNNNARNSLRIIMSSLGVTTVNNATSASEALRLIKARNYDLILADYHLEDGRDSQQLLEELRQQRLLSLSTVYILITAERGYHNVISVAEFGPDDYLIKPFSAEQLQARLARAIYKKRFFTSIYEHLERGGYNDALTACDALLNKDNPFMHDTLRFRGEILNALERYTEALTLFQQARETVKAPWVRMGLATALRGKGYLSEAEAIAHSLINDFPEYLAAYDFVSSVLEEMGKSEEAQQILQRASEISPNNSIRQRIVGDIAVRNKDTEAAEQAYAKVFERRQGSSLRSVDDYANLSRVMIDNGHLDGVRRITQDLRRDMRGNKQGELTALVIDSLCAYKDGNPDKSKQALEKALTLHAELKDQDGNIALPQKISVDLAYACLVGGEEETANSIISQIAAENHENRNMIAQIEDVFIKSGKEEEGHALMSQVGKKIVEINQLSNSSANDSEREKSLPQLIEAAKRIPNMQFLLNACNAIFTQLDQKGWDRDLATQALDLLNKAHTRNAAHPKLVATREMYRRTAKKYGIDVVPQGWMR